MQTPIMLAMSATSLSNSVANYCSLLSVNGANPWTSNATNSQMPIPVAGTFSNLRIRFPATGSGTYAVTIQKNGSDTALTCTVNLASTSTASDLTHSFTVAAGDLVQIKVTPTSTPTAQTVVQISMLFTATTSGESVLFGGTRSTTSSSTLYYSFGSAGAGSATAANTSMVCSTAGVIDKLYVNLSTAPTAGNSYAVEVFKNGSATGVTCTISDTATTGSDLTNTVSVSQGDLITVKQTPTGTPAAMALRAGVRFTPTTNGESMLGCFFSTVPTANVDRFIAVSGSSGDVSDETLVYNLAPVAFTAKKMALSLGTGPGGGTRTRSVWLRQGTGSQSDTSLTCTCTDTATTANDNSNTVSVAADDLIDIRTNSSASATSPSNMRVGVTAYIAPAATSAPNLLLLGVG